eukprot:2067604-Rhodomonas_salina.1
MRRAQHPGRDPFSLSEVGEGEADDPGRGQGRFLRDWASHARAVGLRSSPLAWGRIEQKTCVDTVARVAALF